MGPPAAPVDWMGFDPRRWRPSGASRPITTNVEALLAENDSLRREVRSLRLQLEVLLQGRDPEPRWSAASSAAANHERVGSSDRRRPDPGPGVPPSQEPTSRAQASARKAPTEPASSRVSSGFSHGVHAAQVQRWGEALAAHPHWQELRIGPPGGLRALEEELRRHWWNPLLTLEEELDRRSPGLGGEVAQALRGPHSRVRWAIRAAFALYGPRAIEWLSEEPLRVVATLLERVQRLEQRPPQANRQRRGTRTANHSGAPDHPSPEPGRGPGDSARGGGARGSDGSSREAGRNAASDSWDSRASQPPPAGADHSGAWSSARWSQGRSSASGSGPTGRQTQADKADDVHQPPSPNGHRPGHQHQQAKQPDPERHQAKQQDAERQDGGPQDAEGQNQGRQQTARQQGARQRAGHQEAGEPDAKQRGARRQDGEPREPGGPESHWRRSGSSRKGDTGEAAGSDAGREASSASGQASGSQEPRGHQRWHYGGFSGEDPRHAALKLLGLEPGAEAVAIKRAYRQLAKRHHPDLGGDAETFRRLDTAYRLLL